jgi:hypothetical protein
MGDLKVGHGSPGVLGGPMGQEGTERRMGGLELFEDIPLRVDGPFIHFDRVMQVRAG